MIEIAGLVIEGIGLVNELYSRYTDLTKWEEADLKVDDDWLPLALSKGILKGRDGDYLWSAEDKVPTHELRGTARVVVAYNQAQKRKYRICRGRTGDLIILMKKSDASDT